MNERKNQTKMEECKAAMYILIFQPNNMHIKERKKTKSLRIEWGCYVQFNSSQPKTIDEDLISMNVMENKQICFN